MKNRLYDEALEKEFNSVGIHFLKEKSISDFAGEYVGLAVELAIPNESKLTVPDFTFSILNKREVAVLATDWKEKRRNEQRLLTFKIYVRCPKDAATLAAVGLSNLAMPFLDFCFYAGNEAIPETFGEDVLTKFRDDAIKGDLGWTMPVRFADPVIDALGKLNDTVLGGMMQEAILYGMLTKF